MKKIFILSFLLIVWGNVFAQGTSSLGQDVNSLTLENKQDEKKEWQKRQSSFAVNYMFPFSNHKMHGGSVGIEGIVKHFLFGIEYLWYKSDYGAIQVPVGGNYRYFPSKQFYIEGRALVGYGRVVIGGYEKNYGYMGLSPRIGILLGKSWGINAGYECDFNFKNFSNPSHRVIVGLVFDIDD